MDAETIRGSIGRGLSVSVLFHLFLVASGIVVLPVVNRVLGGTSGMPEAPVMSVNLDDLFADVAASSAVDEEVDSPLLAEHNSRAADQVDGDTGNPIPDGGEVSMDNSIDGTRDEIETGTETQSDALMQPETGPPPQNDPVADSGPKPSDQSILDRVAPVELSQARTPSAKSMFSGVPEPPMRPGHGDQNRPDVAPTGADVGEFSFSTKAWEWEPYWNHMKRRLYRSWVPPAAFSQLGMLEGGYTLVQIEIGRDGKPRSIKVLEDKQGHSSLHQSSYAAMVGAAPFRALPANFPDETLIVTVRFIYLDPNRGGR
jgi:hypothetical protein